MEELACDGEKSWLRYHDDSIARVKRPRRAARLPSRAFDRNALRQTVARPREGSMRMWHQALSDGMGKLERRGESCGESCGEISAECTDHPALSSCPKP
jgi:hypothetical protein